MKKRTILLLTAVMAMGLTACTNSSSGELKREETSAEVSTDTEKTKTITITGQIQVRKDKEKLVRLRPSVLQFWIWQVWILLIIWEKGTVWLVLQVPHWIICSLM